MYRNILIVDDDPDIINLVTLFLEQSGYAVVAVKDGYTALDEVNNHHYDLILLDKNMPFVTGDQVLKSLRNNEITKELPIIMLTASTEVEDVKKSKELGVDDYVIKPPDKKTLVTRIEKILGSQPKHFEIVFDDNKGKNLGLSSQNLNLTLLSANVGGLIMRSSREIKKGTSLGTAKIKLFEVLGIDFSKLKINHVEIREDKTYELFVSFLSLSKADTEKIRDWIVTKKFNLTKA
ncbi:MAG: hypothetical protein A4S09_13085 [Proteobacteria bacterium SG_bin7]|nr:MAG: hypothetical protein A4S09_13085 [Proteobacteria bacterium SG_bin7]